MDFSSITTPLYYSRILEQYLPEPHAGFLVGILFGGTKQLDRNFVDALQTTGTIHIAALSGMNISILSGGTVLLLSRWLGRRIALVLAGFVTIGFILFVGPSASIVRAGVMAFFVYSSTLLGRQYAPITTLCLTVSAMLLVHPAYGRDVGFWLSVFATLGIVLFPLRTHHSHGVSQTQRESSWSKSATTQASRLPRIAQTLLSMIWVDFYVTLAAQVFTLPVIFAVFRRISLIAPFTNMLIGWTIAPLMCISLFVIIGGIIFPIAALPLSWVAWALSSYTIGIIQFTSTIPYATIEW